MKLGMSDMRTTGCKDTERILNIWI